MAFLVDGGKAIDSALIDEKTFSALNEDRLRILKELAREPLYPARLARMLRMQVQTVYYHMRLLKQEGLVELEATEEKGGLVAKRFRAKSNAFSVVVNDSAWKAYSPQKSKLPFFLDGFVVSGVLDAKIVLGSPDPHGKYRARGSEFCATELAMFLGGFASFNYPLYLLDTELKEKARQDNLVVLGGPKVNSLTEQLNPFLPVKFDENFDVYSTLSKKRYGEEVGIIQVAGNPFNKAKKVLVLAGSNHSATRVAVLALLKERKVLEQGNFFDGGVFAKVVQGFDEDGDGIVDAVEVLE